MGIFREERGMVHIGVFAVALVAMTAIWTTCSPSDDELFERKMREYRETKELYISGATSDMEALKKCVEMNDVKEITKPPVKCKESKSLMLLPKAFAESSTGMAIGGGEPSSGDIGSIELSPGELYYDTATKDNCYVSQTEKNHLKSNGRLATDVACGLRAMLYAPDYNGEINDYSVERQAFPDTGNTLLLHFKRRDGIKMFWLIGHVESRLGTGDVTKTGRVIGQMDLSGITTGYHSHIELWMGENMETGEKVSYSSSTKALVNYRKKTYWNWKPDRLAITHYDLGDVAQNDDSPCIGASGKDMCALAKGGEKMIALVEAVRVPLDVKYGDKVVLSGGNCPGVYTVEDNMGPRFRYSCIKSKSGLCIGADIASYKGNMKHCGGDYFIRKAK